MSTEDPDIVEMDFPPYVEEQSPFPDVEPDFNFEDNKEEIYLRNRIIAAQEQVKLLKEEERKRLEKQEKFREMTQAAKTADRAVMAAKRKRHWDKLVLPVSIITICAIISLIVVLSGRTSKPPASVYDLSYEESLNYLFAEMRLTETTMAVPETEAVTQVSREPVVTKSSKKTTKKEETQIILDKDPFSAYDERIDEILKTTVVREPLEAAEGEYVFNTDVMSYKITPSTYAEVNWKGLPIKGSVSVTANITVKNLTDYDYALRVCDFDLYAEEAYESLSRDFPQTISGYDEELAEYYESGRPEWLHFDENGLCSFTITKSGYRYLKKNVTVGYHVYTKNWYQRDNYKYAFDKAGLSETVEIPENKREWVTVE